MCVEISPGGIYVLYLAILYGKPKDKYCILACIDPKVRLLLINSEPSKLKREQPALWEAQVSIDKDAHTFLTKDSYIDCTDPIGYDLDEIKIQIEKDPSIYKGEINGNIRQRIIAALDNDLIPKRQHDWMVDSLSS